MMKNKGLSLCDKSELSAEPLLLLLLLLNQSRLNNENWLNIYSKLIHGREPKCSACWNKHTSITIRGTGKYHGRDKVSKIDKKKIMLPCLHNPVIFHSYVLEFPRNIHNLKRTKKVNDDWNGRRHLCVINFPYKEK